jgi:hypothetical protein
MAMILYKNSLFCYDPVRIPFTLFSAYARAIVFPAYVIKAYREIRGIAPLNFSLWEDNIKMDLREVGWGMGWINLARDRDKWRALVNAVMNLRVP